jgi:hypothetical protein
MERVDAMTFRPGVLGAHDSVKGFRVVATDGRAGRVSWASYAPGESYLVVTLGLLRKHHVVPAAAVTSVGDGEVHVVLSRVQIAQLHNLSRPQAPVEGRNLEQAMAAFERAASVPQTGGF